MYGQCLDLGSIAEACLHHPTIPVPWFNVRRSRDKSNNNNNNNSHNNNNSKNSAII